MTRLKLQQGEKKNFMFKNCLTYDFLFYKILRKRLYLVVNKHYQLEILNHFFFNSDYFSTLECIFRIVKKVNNI